MPIPFATDEWIKALMAQLNASETYREAAKTWEGDFYFVVSSDSGATDGHLHRYMDLWHGIRRDAYAVTDPATQMPEFVIEAPLAVWRNSASFNACRTDWRGRLHFTRVQLANTQA
jgi:hypothetical protein